MACCPFNTHHDTLEFALQFGRTFQQFHVISENELVAATKMIKDRWERIQKTQHELRKLDSELSIATHKLSVAEKTLKTSESYDFDFVRWIGKQFRPIYYMNLQKRDGLRQRVYELHERIRALEKKPPNLLFGLPRSQDCAYLWLFFLFMPDEFRNLAAIAQLGQSKLWRSPPSAQVPKLSLTSWYKSHHLVYTADAKDAELILNSNSPVTIPQTPNIRNYQEETGVQFPDSLSVNPVWRGIDPFGVELPFHDTVKFFTENLPRETQQKEYMESFLFMLPTSIRENEAIARRELKPEWLNPVQFIAFANLRAHPHTQIHCLIEALHDELLPFQDCRVHILIKQLLYHIGNDDWKIDIADGWYGYKRLADELSCQLEKIRDSPKDSDQLVIYGHISSYLGQSDQACMDLSFQFYVTGRRWADNEAAEGDCLEEASPQQRWKQAKLYGHALLCLSLGDFDNRKYVELIESLVLFRKNLQLAPVNDVSRSLNQAVEEMMARRVRGLALFVAKNTPVLTRCLSLLFTNMPEELAWSSACSQLEIKQFVFKRSTKICSQ